MKMILIDGSTYYEVSGELLRRVALATQCWRRQSGAKHMPLLGSYLLAKGILDINC